MGSADMLKSTPVCHMCIGGQSASRVIRPVHDADSAQVCGPTWGHTCGTGLQPRGVIARPERLPHVRIALNCLMMSNCSCAADVSYQAGA